MMDMEVLRLRRLRRTALLTRSLAHAMRAAFPLDTVFARGAVAAWSVARLINGRLRAHPNLSCQRGPGAIQTVIDESLAAVTAWVAVRQGRARTVVAQQLNLLARELDDTRALTWSADFGDALGRAKWQLLRLGQEFKGAASAPRGEAVVGSPPNPTDWPYLAI
jgi:hypothetical protein